MWNYSFTLPSAMILLILVTYYFRRPRLPIRMNKTFLALLCVDALTLLADYVSSRVDETWMNHSLAVGYALNLTFFVFFLARIYCFFLFILDIIENHVRLPGWVRRFGPAMCILAELIALSSPVTHAVFYMDETGYHRGALYGIIYVCFFFYLAAALVLILRCKKRLPGPVQAGLLAIVGILFVGNIVRMLLPTLLVMNTFCLMAILAIYLSFGNPDLFLSDRGKAFNTRGFNFILKEWNKTRPYRVLAFVIRNYSETRSIYGGIQIDQSIRLINRFLFDSFPNCLNFYLRNGSFALLGPADMDCRAMCEKIDRRFEQPWENDGTELMMKPAFVEMDSEIKGDAADRIVGMLLLALDNAGQSGYATNQGAPLSIHAVDSFIEHKRALDMAQQGRGLEVYLQPLVDCKSGRVVAAEALARLRTEDGRMIPPSEFIPIAEKDGSIISLGEQVLGETCRFIRDHDLEAMGLRWINVNLSPYQCMSKDLAQRFEAILKEYDVPAELIHLELTEQSITDYSLLSDQLMALQALGFQFALDDYGSGYSNLSRVKQYPFKNIKVDMAVVWDYFRDRDQLLPTLIQVFKQMNFSTTAEGIETREMAEAMTQIGFDYLQGYYYSKPIPIPAFLDRYSKAT